MTRMSRFFSTSSVVDGVARQDAASYFSTQEDADGPEKDPANTGNSKSAIHSMPLTQTFLVPFIQWNHIKSVVYQFTGAAKDFI
jgi:hypothetical protein